MGRTEFKRTLMFSNQACKDVIEAALSDRATVAKSSTSAVAEDILLNALLPAEVPWRHIAELVYTSGYSQADAWEMVWSNLAIQNNLDKIHGGTAHQAISLLKDWAVFECTWKKDLFEDDHERRRIKEGLVDIADVAFPQEKENWKNRIWSNVWFLHDLSDNFDENRPAPFALFQIIERCWDKIPLDCCGYVYHYVARVVRATKWPDWTAERRTNFIDFLRRA